MPKEDKSALLPSIYNDNRQIVVSNDQDAAKVRDALNMRREASKIKQLPSQDIPGSERRDD